MDKKQERAWASEHRKSAEERRIANVDARDISILVLPDKEKTLDEE